MKSAIVCFESSNVISRHARGISIVSVGNEPAGSSGVPGEAQTAEDDTHLFLFRDMHRLSTIFEVAPN